MTIEPARLLGLDPEGIGRLQVGGPADLTVIDPTCEWTIDAAEFASKARNCPFDGRQVSGRAVLTLIGGRIACDRLQTASAMSWPDVSRSPDLEKSFRRSPEMIRQEGSCRTTPVLRQWS